jgi:hypothetical protein
MFAPLIRAPASHRGVLGVRWHSAGLAIFSARRLTAQ